MYVRLNDHTLAMNGQGIQLVRECGGYTWCRDNQQGVSCCPATHAWRCRDYLNGCPMGKESGMGDAKIHMKNYSLSFNEPQVSRYTWW